MKKLFAFCAGLLAVLNQTAVTALAAEPEAAGAAAQTPLWLCIPFAGLLLCIAVLPLVKAEWWEAHQPHAVVFWSLLFLIPFAVKYGVPKAAETTLECIINDYLTFIVLLFRIVRYYSVCLPCQVISLVSEDQCGTSGTRNPVIQLDRNHRSQYVNDPSDHQDERVEKKTPHRDLLYLYGVQYGRLPDSIGDPPLLMGFMRGVPFFWSLKLLPI